MWASIPSSASWGSVTFFGEHGYQPETSLYAALCALLEQRVANRRADAEPPDDLGDARQGERRQRPESRMSERRQAERRRRAPDTWGTLGFLVLHDEEGPA